MPDYIIVGAGSAGCVLATRLSEDPDVSVLLLEAGPRDTDRYIHMPVGFFKISAGPLSWGYETEPGRVTGHSIPYPQGRVLGGGSSINAQVFTRGCPEDYDAWAEEEGCTGWSFREILPLFIRSEDNDTFVGPYHGHGGPLGVSSGTPHPLTRAFVQAAQEAGLPFTPDFNGLRQAGTGYYQTTTRGGRRCSTAVGYLRPALGRPNLTVRTEVLIRRIVIENGRAVGVEISAEGGASEVVRAEREVLVCAGAIGSPKLLMLSGIGPAAHLAEHGIPVVNDLQGVGQNLQDHTNIDVVFELTGPYSYDKYKQLHWKLLAGLEYLAFGKGPVASNIVEGGAFWWGDRSEKTPDLQFHFLPGAGVEKGVGSVPGGNGCTLNSYHLRPRSRGSVTLRSADPKDAPRIDPNVFAEPYDLARAVDGVKISQEIMAQSAMARFIRREHIPGPGVRTLSEYQDFARQAARTAYHPVGTCRMGRGPEAVVDPELRVHGIDGLRVCDSSIMPRLVSSNTNAPTVMIGEKASDLVRGNRTGAEEAASRVEVVEV